MSKTVKVSLPPEMTDDLVAAARAEEGILGIEYSAGTSRRPAGDSISFTVTDRGMLRLMRVFDRLGIGSCEGTSISVGELTAVISPEAWPKMGSDPSEISFEEMEVMSGRASNMTRDTLVLMAVSGFIAAFGIATQALHVVIGAMVVAPGFLPLTRIGLGLAAGRQSLVCGLRDTGLGYLALAVGAGLAWLVLAGQASPVLGREPAYLEPGVLVRYWSQPTLEAALVSAAAAVAGALLVASNRSALTGGVMIALALIPAAVLSCLAVFDGDYQLAGQALGRWSIEVVLVVACGYLTFLWKRWVVHRRRMML